MVAFICSMSCRQARKKHRHVLLTFLSDLDLQQFAEDSYFELVVVFAVLARSSWMCNKAELSSRVLRRSLAQSSRWLEAECLIVTHVTGDNSHTDRERGEHPRLQQPIILSFHHSA